MDYIPVYEGDDSRRRLGETVARKDPAHRREIRARGQAGDPHHDPRTRHDPARRAAGVRDRDAVGKLRPEGRRRHHRFARRQGPAADGGLQPGRFVCGRRIHRHHHVQDDRRRRRLRPRIAATADEPRRARGGDRGHRKEPERSDLDRMDGAARRHRAGAQRDRGHARSARRRAVPDRRSFGDLGADRRRRARSRRDRHRPAGDRAGPQLSRARVHREGRA